jgi:hypothetical protein
MAFIEAAVTQIAAGTSLVSGTDLFIARMPSAPDTAVGVYEYDGELPQYVMGAAGAVVDRPRLQVISRAVSYATARDTLATIRVILDAQGVTWSGVGTLRVEPLGSILSLGPDEKDRMRCSCSFVGTIIR